jgi:hypothetical protein
VSFGLDFWIWYFGMGWHGMGWHGVDLVIFGMDGKGHRYETWIVSWVAGATFLFTSSS